jgi:uncharacterized protein YgbK (DUF1537 family)
VKQALVIADDLSGAAELAGIGLRYGLSVTLLRGERAISMAGGGETNLTVIDTDSRSLDHSAATQRLRDIAGPFIKKILQAPGARPLIYKKIDSVLRGPIRAEMETLMELIGAAAGLIVPQNPSRGRTIAHGLYLIDGTPLDRTSFARDPEYPATTADVSQLVGTGRLPIRYAESAVEHPLANGLMIGGGATAAHLAAWAAAVDESVLPAGGADFFEAMLVARRLGRPRTGDQARPTFAKLSGAILFVSGTTSAAAVPSFVDCTALMPSAVFEAACAVDPKYVFGQASRTELGQWQRSICDALDGGHSPLVAVRRPAVADRPTAPRQIASQLAEVVASALAMRPVDWLVIEGGATASALLDRCDWNNLFVVDELAPGIVLLRVPDAAAPFLIVKPGSYAWPELSS